MVLIDIDVEEEAENLYTELLKIEVAQKKRNERDISGFNGNAINKCRNLKRSLYR